ncbi:MAG: SGNH/GDSL hydrolase family protein, partial [Planctomycetes bacterium]|nr:SGNH/GDSL hydrolase family protein [Planctomycetota bacterium]
MVRASLRFVQRLFCSAILLVLIACGAEVGLRTFEMSQGQQSLANRQTSKCVEDPSGLLIPSWTTFREWKPHANAKVSSKDQRRLIEIRTNSLGLRGPEVTVPKPPGVFRIVLLGDESIVAPEVTEKAHLAYSLNGLLQKLSSSRIEVINAGLPGGCPLTEFLLVKQRLLAIQPDLVLLHYDWSDVADDHSLRRMTRCDKKGFPLSCPHPSLASVQKLRQPIDKLRNEYRLVDLCLSSASQSWKREIAEQSASTRDIGTNPYAWLRSDRAEATELMMQSFEPIESLKRLSAAGRFQLAVFTSPKPWQVSTECSSGKGVRLACGVAEEAHYSNRSPFDALAEYVTGLGIQYADASDILMTGPDVESNFFRYSPRWS